MLREFSTGELRRRFANAFSPRPLLYWSDFLASAGMGWGMFVVSAGAPFGSWMYGAATVIAVVALLRAVIFIHELTHVRAGCLPGFSLAWHVCIGLPLLLPGLMYVGSHNDHHRQSTFGTRADPEYAPIAQWSRSRISWSVLSLVIVPFLLMLRWGVLGPLSFAIPPLRRLLIERASTLVINLDYRRSLPQGKQARSWLVQEVAVAVVFWGIMVGLYEGLLPFRWVVQWYVVATGLLLVNQVRTLAAHRYDNDGARLDVVAQLLDSVTLNGWPIPTVLAAPVGLRFHALHHLLPTVPYHALGTIHRILLSEFPADSPYARTQERGILAAVRVLLRHAKKPEDHSQVAPAAPEA
jgi:fatty acid desaturase